MLTLMPPRLGLLVDDLLQVLVEPFAFGQERVEVGLAENRAQRGLGDLRGGFQVALDVHDGVDRIDDPEVGDGVDARRHVVARDDLLRRNVQGDGPQVDAHHAIDDRDEQDEPGALGAQQPAEPEDHPPLVLAQDADGRGEQDGEERRECHDDGECVAHEVSFSMADPPGRTWSVSPATASTRTCSPTATRRSEVVCARQR
jgi:hypothetical protein